LLGKILSANKNTDGWRFMGIIQKKSIRGESTAEGKLDQPAFRKPQEWVPLEEDLQTVAFLAKSLSDENRLRILLSLNGGRKSVNSIVEELNLSQPLVSHHLKELKRSLLVRVERQGPFIYYEMADKKPIDIIKAIAGLGKGLLAKRRTF
jgi:ArsR family transcriptional regulator, zinc-responsive transcriptional repressor